MAKTVQILGRTYLPGPGWTTSGVPKQGKTMTWGHVNISSYTAGGEPLTPNDVGLTTVDFLQANVVSVAGTEIGTVEASAVYQYTSQELVVFEAAANEVDTEAAVCRFFAVGDSARDVESLA